MAARPPRLWQVATMRARVAASSCVPVRMRLRGYWGHQASRGVRVRAGTAERFRARRLAPGVVASVLLSGLLVGSGTASAAVPQGCHGAATLAYKQATNDPGGQGSAIGGQGNSDDNPFNGQAHSAVVRGETLQQFLAAVCGLGSEQPEDSRRCHSAWSPDRRVSITRLFHRPGIEVLRVTPTAGMVGRVRGADGRQRWIRAGDIRPAKDG
jgi:hypothetical protein